MASVLAALVIIVIGYIALQLKSKKKGNPFPGPPSAPVLGNLLQLPTTKVWERLYDWGLTYGAYASRVLLSLRDIEDEPSTRPNIPNPPVLHSPHSP